LDERTHLLESTECVSTESLEKTDNWCQDALIFLRISAVALLPAILILLVLREALHAWVRNETFSLSEMLIGDTSNYYFPSTKPVKIRLENQLLLNSIAEEKKPWDGVLNVLANYRRDGVNDEIIRYKSESQGVREFGFSCTIVNLPDKWKQTRYIVGWKPKVRKSSSIRHMNVYGTPVKLAENFHSSKRWCSFMTDLMEPLISYDRGALPFFFDSGQGMIGPGSGRIQLVLEIHYLFPKYWSENEHFLRKNGLKIFTTIKEPLEEMNLFGWFNTGEVVPQQNMNYDFTARAFANWRFKTFFDQFPRKEINVHYIHQHHHQSAKSTFVQIFDKDGRRKFRSSKEALDPGDFRTQTFLPVKGLKIGKGDILEIHCFYDTTNVENPTFFGLGNGDELCGALFYASIPTKYHSCQRNSLYAKGGSPRIFPKGEKFFADSNLNLIFEKLFYESSLETFGPGSDAQTLNWCLRDLQD